MVGGSSLHFFVSQVLNAVENRLSRFPKYKCFSHFPPPAMQPSNAHSVLHPQLVVDVGVTAIVAWYL
jgi:hypothetical protein